MAGLSKLSLYLHIPFCPQRCRYCDFYSLSRPSRELIKKTTGELLQQTRRQLEILRPGKVTTLFIGGGTPSLLPPEILRVFLEDLQPWLPGLEEGTLEANPESLSREKLQILAAGGIGRLSLGVQTYRDDLLRWLGRPAGIEALRGAEEELARHWQGRLNRDLLAGLPRPPGGLVRDLKQALQGDPGHISLYDLVLEEGTPLALAAAEKRETLPSEEQKAREWEEAWGFLQSRGYARYEISHFAKPGEESRHSLACWRMEPALGIGPGAVSTLPGAGGKVLRCKEKADLSAWLADADQVRDIEEITPGNLALEFFIMGLRMAEGLSRERFFQVFGLPLEECVPESLERETQGGGLIWDEKALRPSPRGMNVLDSILLNLAGELDKFPQNQEINWPL